MVESAGGRGRAGPGPPPARLPAAAAVNFPQRAWLASLRTPTPARAGKEPWLPEAQE